MGVAEEVRVEVTSDHGREAVVGRKLGTEQTPDILRVLLLLVRMLLLVWVLLLLLNRMMLLLVLVVMLLLLLVLVVSRDQAVHVLVVGLLDVVAVLLLVLFRGCHYRGLVMRFGTGVTGMLARVLVARLVLSSLSSYLFLFVLESLLSS